MVPWKDCRSIRGVRVRCVIASIGCFAPPGRLLFAIWVLFFLMLRLSLALNICGHCGHEMPTAASFCHHCGGSVSTTAPMDPEPDPILEPSASTVMAPADIVEVAHTAFVADWAQANRLFEAGRPDLAYFFYRNAQAFSGWVRPGVIDGNAAAHLLSRMAACLQRMTASDRDCPLCDGSGRGVRFIEFLTGEGTVQDAGPGSCRHCRGRSRVPGRKPPSEIRTEMAQAMHAVERYQHGEGRVALGAAWVPAEWPATLDVRTEIAVRRAVAAPCSACFEQGQADCGRCRGSGWTGCLHEGCRDGRVRRDESLSLRGTSAVIRYRACPVCQGSGRGNCSDCRGTGGVACGRCGATGQRLPCTRCAGEALHTCRRCSGSGTRGTAACEDCQSAGVVRCPACQGDGRAKP